MISLSTLAILLAGAQDCGGSVQYLASHTSPTAFGRFGSAIASGDVNGDGHLDLVISAPTADPNRLAESGSVFVYDRTGPRRIFRLDGPIAWSHFGTAVALADLDLDGCDDIIVGALEDASGHNPVSHVYVYSGRTGLLMHTLEGPVSSQWFGGVVAVGDVNGDGVADIAVGAQMAHHNRQYGVGKVYVYSGSDFSLLNKFFGSQADDRFGRRILLEDLNADGVAELIVSSEYMSPGGISRAGSAEVWNVTAGQLIARFDGQQQDDWLGYRIAAADLDRDGVQELLLGVPGADPGGIAQAGEVRAFSAHQMRRLRVWSGSAPEELLGSEIATGDLDGDGHADVVFGFPHATVAGVAGIGQVRGHSGADGSRLFQLDGLRQYRYFGYHCHLADLDEDGLDEVFVNEPNGGYGGMVHVFAFDPFLHVRPRSVSASRGGHVEFRLDFPSTAADGKYLLTASASGPGETIVNGVCIPLRLDQLSTRFLTAPPSGSIGTRGLLGNDGRALAELNPLPQQLNHFVGRTLWFAAIVYESGASVLATSRPVPLRILP